jgi:hypothetical protein
MGIVSPAQRRWLISELPEFPNCLHQPIKSELSIFYRLPHAILHDPALKVYRLSGWGWQLYSGSILEHPSDLLKVFPGTLAGPAGSFQLIE